MTVKILKCMIAEQRAAALMTDIWSWRQQQCDG